MTPRVTASLASTDQRITTRAVESLTRLLRLRYTLIGFTAGLLTGGLLLGAIP